MPMIWNAEADAKLFLGVLNQVKDANVKLDCKKLADFMGPDCIAGAVQNRLVRLKKKAEADMGGSVSASPAAANGAETAGPAEGNGGGAVEISTGSPKKRKAAPRKKKGEESPKKVKPEPESEPEDGDQDMI
ncbi:hypothetical protein ASPSYDRAFT_129001 [Aspergillus sydowii CBS 593.65]|uniref:Uncharacterized protein n=1 Tax=Aspergillus sydowii CBS 593.65 TaxID=1036612 RepID=A0A1L9TRV5_9EURO|nr:uncharacterized protein ASPSYDRAFT_129001 [Aspergillus sydowii CBS 593.65]OJJ62095.1 hypothetical protein ASPSYDRAFT_129001 [Aspergillus sydowii CBS 593.65]